MQLISFKSVPNVLIVEINSKNIKLNKTLQFEQKGETVVLDVRGLTYHGDFHFTSHIIGTDGMTTESSCENEGDFDKVFSRNLLKCQGEKKLILMVYARVQSEGENENEWMGGIILYLPPRAIQLACVNSPIFLKLKII
jgi:hypothetical protein